MKKRLFAGALLAFSVSGAYAGSWIALENDELTSIYVDPSTLVRHKGNVQIRVKDVFGDPQPYPMHSFPVKSQVSLWLFDCTHKTWAMGLTTTYGPQSGQVDVSPEYPDEFNTVSPDSMQEKVMDYACAKS
ncbi:surface-adhesin E family protein [Paraburkholderia adhaesiva]|uniref:surface-adhesin E family protein n=1 Tax=Paraburkholderia adhaesiva TaxID=2883244 RepID=UPI001F373007|nr:surface-adhesin E family protein [Paraburkholderia adhaesiva]